MGLMDRDRPPFPAGEIEKRVLSPVFPANLTLAEVAKRAGISAPRVSQIQTQIERGKLGEPLRRLIDGYKVKA